MTRPFQPSADGSNSGRTPSAVLSTMLRSASIGGFEYCERQVVARRMNPRHSHDYHCIGFLISGLGTAEFDSECWTVRPGCLNVIPGGVQHVERFGSPQIRWCGIEIPAPRDEFAAEAKRAFERPMQWKAGPAAGIAARIYRELRVDDDVSPLSLHGLGLELLATLARASAPAAGRGQGAWMARVEEYLRANFLEAITLDEVAEEAGVVPTHLARVFRRQIGSSMGQFVRGLRVEHAAGLLAQGELSLSEIAQASGFSDQAHFTRVFKRHLGVTPGTYRHRLRGR